MTRSITARRLTSGVRLTHEVPDGSGDLVPADPVTVTDVEHEPAGTVLARFDVGISIRFQPGQRLELAPAASPEGANQ